MTATTCFSLVIGLALLSFPAAADAGQSDADELQRLRSALMREVRIKDADGVTHRGMLTAIDSGDLVVNTAGGQVRVPIASARRIARRGDSVKEGALFGLAYGLFAMRYAGQGADTPDEAVIVTVMAPVMCTLIGAGLDALENGWTTVYRRDKREPTVTLVESGVAEAGRLSFPTVQRDPQLARLRCDRGDSLLDGALKGAIAGGVLTLISRHGARHAPLWIGAGIGGGVLVGAVIDECRWR